MKKVLLLILLCITFSCEQEDNIKNNQAVLRSLSLRFGKQVSEAIITDNSQVKVFFDFDEDSPTYSLIENISTSLRAKLKIGKGSNLYFVDGKSQLEVISEDGLNKKIYSIEIVNKSAALKTIDFTVNGFNFKGYTEKSIAQGSFEIKSVNDITIPYGINVSGLDFIINDFKVSPAATLNYHKGQKISLHPSIDSSIKIIVNSQDQKHSSEYKIRVINKLPAIKNLSLESQVTGQVYQLSFQNNDSFQKKLINTSFLGFSGNYNISRIELVHGASLERINQNHQFNFSNLQRTHSFVVSSESGHNRTYVISWLDEQNKIDRIGISYDKKSYLGEIDNQNIHFSVPYGDYSSRIEAVFSIFEASSKVTVNPNLGSVLVFNNRQASITVIPKGNLAFSTTYYLNLQNSSKYIIDLRVDVGGKIYSARPVEDVLTFVLPYTQKDINNNKLEGLLSGFTISHKSKLSSELGQKVNLLNQSGSVFSPGNIDVISESGDRRPYQIKVINTSAEIEQIKLREIQPNNIIREITLEPNSIKDLVINASDSYTYQFIEAKISPRARLDLLPNQSFIFPDNGIHSVNVFSEHNTNEANTYKIVLIKSETSLGTIRFTLSGKNCPQRIVGSLIELALPFVDDQALVGVNIAEAHAPYGASISPPIGSSIFFPKNQSFLTVNNRQKTFRYTIKALNQEAKIKSIKFVKDLKKYRGYIDNQNIEIQLSFANYDEVLSRYTPGEVPNKLIISNNAGDLSLSYGATINPVSFLSISPEGYGSISVTSQFGQNKNTYQVHVLNKDNYVYVFRASIDGTSYEGNIRHYQINGALKGVIELAIPLVSEPSKIKVEEIIMSKNASHRMPEDGFLLLTKDKDVLKSSFSVLSQAGVKYNDPEIDYDVIIKDTRSKLNAISFTYNGNIYPAVLDQSSKTVSVSLPFERSLPNSLLINSKDISDKATMTNIQGVEITSGSQLLFDSTTNRAFLVINSEAAGINKTLYQVILINTSANINSISLNYNGTIYEGRIIDNSVHQVQLDVYNYNNNANLNLISSEISIGANIEGTSWSQGSQIYVVSQSGQKKNYTLVIREKDLLISNTIFTYENVDYQGIIVEKKSQENSEILLPIASDEEISTVVLKNITVIGGISVLSPGSSISMNENQADIDIRHSNGLTKTYKVRKLNTLNEIKALEVYFEGNIYSSNINNNDKQIIINIPYLTLPNSLRISNLRASYGVTFNNQKSNIDYIELNRNQSVIKIYPEIYPYQNSSPASYSLRVEKTYDISSLGVSYKSKEVSAQILPAIKRIRIKIPYGLAQSLPNSLEVSFIKASGTTAIAAGQSLSFTNGLGKLVISNPTVTGDNIEYQVNIKNSDANIYDLDISYQNKDYSFASMKHELSSENFQGHSIINHISFIDEIEPSSSNIAISNLILSHGATVNSIPTNGVINSGNFYADIIVSSMFNSLKPEDLHSKKVHRFIFKSSPDSDALRAVQTSQSGYQEFIYHSNNKNRGYFTANLDAAAMPLTVLLTPKLIKSGCTLASNGQVYLDTNPISEYFGKGKLTVNLEDGKKQVYNVYISLVGPALRKISISDTNPNTNFSTPLFDKQTNMFVTTLTGVSAYPQTTISISAVSGYIRQGASLPSDIVEITPKTITIFNLEGVNPAQEYTIKIVIQ